GAAHRCLQSISKRAASDIGQLIPLLFCVPCFKASHFFFKLAYALQQRLLRVACSEEFFLQFYDRRVATGGVVNILKSLREIERGLEGTKASKCFSNHDVSSSAKTASPSA